MSKLLFILTILPIVWAQEPVQASKGTPTPDDNKSLLVICDLQGALFFPKTANQKVAAIQNPGMAQQLKKHQQEGAKLLYVAEHQADLTFWHNSVKASGLPFETRFSLSNEAFHGFEKSLPSCRAGVVLCQGQPLGETLGVVINQLWIWTQFLPTKILFYTSSKQRGDIVTVIGNRIGASVEVKLVKGIVGMPPIMPIAKTQSPPTKPKQTINDKPMKLPEKQTHQTAELKKITKKQPVLQPTKPQSVAPPAASRPRVQVLPDTEIKPVARSTKIDESNLETA